MTDTHARYLKLVRKADDLDVDTMPAMRGGRGSSDILWRKEQAARTEALGIVAKLLGGGTPAYCGAPPIRLRWAEFFGFDPDCYLHRFSIDGPFSVIPNAKAALDHGRVSAISRSRGRIATIISAPYPRPPLRLGDNVVGIVLAASWYGYGSVGIAWVRREAEAPARQALGPLAAADLAKVERDRGKVMDRRVAASQGITGIPSEPLPWLKKRVEV